MKNLIWISILIPFLFCNSLFADAQAVINGPSESSAGDLIILDASRSEGLQFEWVLTNSDKTYLPVENGLKLVFSSGAEGSYIFVLVVGGEDNNGKLVVDTAKHTVVIGNSPGPTPPKPIPPKPKPQPEPDPIVLIPEGPFQISKTIYDFAKTTGDRSTALKIALNFQSVSSMIAAGGFDNEEDLPLAVIKMTTAINAESAGGQDTETYNLWKDKLFAPLSGVLNDLSDDEKLVTKEDHKQCWSEISKAIQIYGEQG